MGTIGKTNWTLGEISPRAFGRFDPDKPIYKNGAAIIENWLITQAGGLMYRPGTGYAGTIKDQTQSVRFERFRYSTDQEYILEIGNIYMRFWAIEDGILVQVLDGSNNPLEIVSPFLQADIRELEMANKADVMYIVHPNYYPHKLIRTAANAFTIANVPFVRGPFLDVNITATTITPSSATGATTLTASTAIFQAGHVGSLWRVKSGVVKITVFTDSQHMNGTVQAEPNGTAGDLGTTSAETDWQEGSFSAVRGYPAAVTFHEQRLLYGGTIYERQKFWASVVATYDDYAVGSASDSDAWTYEIASNVVNDIRWMSSDTALKFGTGGGTITANDQGTAGITASSPPQIIIDTDYSVQHIEPERIGGYFFYIQANSFNLRQLVFNLIESRDKSEDMCLISDHILRDGGGCLQIARQQSPCDRIWAIRADGQLAVFTRNVDQQVQAWGRLIAGYTSNGPGSFETIAILPQDSQDDLICVVVKRIVNGVTKRFVEYFTYENFIYDWEPVRLDASLSIDNPITVSAITNASPGVITATAHGLANGDQVKIDNITTFLAYEYDGLVEFGLVGLNTNVYLVANVTTNTLTLTDTDGNAIDTTNMGIYIGGGEVRKMVKTFSGLDHLEGEVVAVTADGALPAATQTFTVIGGSITLVNAAAVVHIGLPYIGIFKFMPLGNDTQGVSHTKIRKSYEINAVVWKSLGGQFGEDINHLHNIIMPNQISNLAAYHSNPAYTGDIIDLPFESSMTRSLQPVLVQNQPLPFMLLAVVIRSEVFEGK